MSRILILLALLSTAAVAQAASVPLYGRFEASFQAADAVAAFSPLAVEFTAPSGKTLRQPAFYDGGRAYRVRFMPTEAGPWRYRTLGDLPGLAGQSGAFDCQRSNSDNRFLKPGPVRTSADGLTLEHADGTPFFLLADTAWNGALLSSDDDWPRYLKNRVDKHFTGIQFVIHAPWRTAPTNREGQVAFTGRANIVIHPEFYQRIDRRMVQVEQAGLIGLPVLLWACTPEDPGRYLPEDDARRLIEYEAARYSAYHTLPILAGDGRYDGDSAKRWQRIGQAVFGQRPPRSFNPVLLHPGGMHWPYDDWRDVPWLEVAGYQSGHGDNDATLRWIHRGPPATKWNATPARVPLNLEPPYEDHISYQSRQKISAFQTRRACWWSLLVAPPAGLTYGAHGIWSWQEKSDVPLNHKNAGIAQPWHIAADLPGATHMKHLADFFTSIPFHQLRPDPALLAEQPGEKAADAFIAAARTADGKLAVLYLPKGGTTKLADASGYKGEWFDPRTGERRPATGANSTFAAPNAEDWVLLLRR